MSLELSILCLQLKSEPPNLMADTLQYDIADDVELLRASAVSAGIIASSYFRREIKTWTKDNASPVSEADYHVDQYLAELLQAARPDYGWLSEESTDNPDRLKATRVFIVDPIDGTRAFIKGDDCWSISLAVVENGVAIAGVVYAPARNELYAAGRKHGAFLNGKPLPGATKSSAEPIIPAPAAVHQQLHDAGLKYTHGPSLPSLAYRLVQVSTGRLDVAVARRGAQDWDIAGAAIILAECGITLEDVCVGEPVFNKADTRHGALAALGDTGLRPIVHDALIEVYGCPEDASNN